MTMARLQHLSLFSFAAVHLLLFSICPSVSGRIYRTSDAIVIEVDDVRPSTLANRNSGNPPLIPMAYASVNPYTGLLSQPYPNFPFWPYYPLYQPASSISDHVENATATSADSIRQQTIACGVGPDLPPKRKNPTVGIVGGSDATPNSWPFIVGLRIAGGNVVCGGSIISQTRILTAAHCVNQLSVFQILTMTVSLGMHTQGNGNDLPNDAQQTRRVTRVVYNTNYNDKTLVNDVAVLTVDPPISYSKVISPVCLPPFNNAADQFAGKDAAIIGWGKFKPDTPDVVGVLSNALQQATVKIIGKAKCNEFWGSTLNPAFNQHICAGADGKDMCQGDSGGPLLVQTKAGSTAWTQIGIVSYGNSCPALSAKPSVYASVAFFRKWIDTYMKN
ncbi:chymotrypsinogen B-like [Daphnia pulex]|uniref:chymotrypsinogen B-like n=1 Tax=Daphnia pulex TaxID=6669 RepID=UPI001EDCE629|nr:chymotrypsinogen B-like [Daphnia pulex]